MSLNYLVYAGSWPEGAQSDAKSDATPLFFFVFGRPTDPGIKGSVVYPFCYEIDHLSTVVSSILSLCRFGDHVLLFSG